jgi:protein phosphatase 2C
VINRGGQDLAMTIDHKPDRYDEHERIKVAGGSVTNTRIPRVMPGKLAVSRSIGDRHIKCHRIKGVVVATPEHQVLSLDNCRSLLLASDGLWDVLSCKEAVVMARRTGSQKRFPR